MNGFDIIELPDDALPEITELDGDMRLLAEIAGVRMALRIAQVFNGTYVRLAKWRGWIIRHRDKCMRRDYDTGGYTGVELARKYYLGERQVWNILGKVEGAPKEDKQLKLF
jgi:Mor family transcriptional regulator